MSRWKALLVACVYFVSAACNADEPAFTVVRVDARTETLSIFLRDESGAPLRRLDRLAAWLKAQNKQLRFAMNAGMFHSDLSPVGLLVQEGRQVSPLNLADGAGNFFLKPNGVFFVAAAGPRIVASEEYPALSRGVRLATQSGPLLVRRGVIHPRYFRDELNCPDALYLDGVVSSLHSADHGRTDVKVDLGPIIGVAR